MLGSIPLLSDWDPGRDQGRGGYRMKWSEGHVWRAELDYEKMRAAGRVEFKFVVKSSHDNSTFNVIRWEGGNLNHHFEASQVQQLLSDSQVKKHVNEQLSQGNTKPFNIGTFSGSGNLVIAGQSHHHMENKADKVTLSFDSKEQALVYKLYW